MEIILVRALHKEALYIDDVKEMESDKLDLADVLEYLKAYFKMNKLTGFDFIVENKKEFDFPDDYYETLDETDYGDINDYY